MGQLWQVSQPWQNGRQGHKGVSLWLWDGGTARCSSASACLHVFLVMARVLASHPHDPAHQGQCHSHLHAEKEQKGGDAELGPGQEKAGDVRASVGSGQ